MYDWIVNNKSALYKFHARSDIVVDVDRSRSLSHRNNDDDTCPPSGASTPEHDGDVNGGSWRLSRG